MVPALPVFALLQATVAPNRFSMDLGIDSSMDQVKIFLGQCDI